ncbi:hypothetical protein TNCT_592421 [Trichonephila clavata]|uniref:C2H2-type domain-containing protein n=1 Tax=Trichonephila clavata TaxID=2740835 RepID=A0A8X6K6S6_TRICU|nr:hypothetical protein TNCT_592421 [Trichonephila clavata]
MNVQEILGSFYLLNQFPGLPLFNCSKCSHSFSHKDHLLHHLEQHKDVYPCTLCANTFTRKDSLKRHERTIHNVINKNSLRGHYNK